MASTNPPVTQFHDDLKPISWLFGSWKAAGGKGIYPTIKDFSYDEEAEFTPLAMKPVVQYRLFSTKANDSTMPMHRESGFIKIKPQSNTVAFSATHSFGVVEIQEGEVKGQEVTVESTSVSRTSFNKPPAVKKTKRTFSCTGDELMYIMYMETENTAMTEHLRITYKKQ